MCLYFKRFVRCFKAFHDHFHDGCDKSFFLHVEQSKAAIIGRQLRGRRVVEYRSRTISDDVRVRQGYFYVSALHSFGVLRLTLFWSIKT